LRGGDFNAKKKLRKRFQGGNGGYCNMGRGVQPPRWGGGDFRVGRKLNIERRIVLW
jgi:hypothetical protein